MEPEVSVTKVNFLCFDFLVLSIGVANIVAVFFSKVEHCTAAVAVRSILFGSAPFVDRDDGLRSLIDKDKGEQRQCYGVTPARYAEKSKKRKKEKKKHPPELKV